MSRTIEIVEVGPRDGLQSEDRILEVDDRIELIRRLIDAGVRRVEVASFVHPDKVPQMAAAEKVVAGLPDDPVTYIGLALNERGLERALATKVDQIDFVVPATESYSQSNQGMAQSQALATTIDMIPLAHTEGRRVGVTISVAFGDAVEGEVDHEWVAELARRLAEGGADEIALGDTIGAGVPADVSALVPTVQRVTAGVPLRCHFHNTRNTGYANAVAAVDAGVRVLDSAVGGYGGSPFTPSAGGNVATEDLGQLLSRSNIEHGLDVNELIETAAWLEQKLGSPVRSMLGKAGPFPPPRSGEAGI